MLCCLDCTPDVTPFPGQNRNGGDYEVQFPPPLVATPGNAFMTYDDYQKQQMANENENEMVRVIVPEGISPGEIIHVTAQDGSGRVIAATVPPGMKPGSMFQVNYPKMNKTHDASTNNITTSTPFNASSEEEKNCHISTEPVFDAQLAYEQTSSKPPNNSTPSTRLDTSNTPTNSAPQNNKSMLLVKVPPGTSPGSTIHVQIPGDTRYVEAVVPPDVDEFFVEYTINRSDDNTTQIQGNNNQTQQNSDQQPNHGNGSFLAPVIAAPLMIGAAGAAGYSMVNNQQESDEHFQDNVDLGDY